MHASEEKEAEEQDEGQSASESDYDSDSSEAAVWPTETSWAGCREGNILRQGEEQAPACWVL